MFNALKYIKILEEVGLTRAQAEAHLQIATEIMESNLASKQDIKDLEIATRGDIKEFSTITNRDIKDLERNIKDLELNTKRDIKDLESKITQTEYRLTIKLGTIISLAIGVAVTLAKLI